MIEKIPELGGGDRHGNGCRRQPEEAASFQPFGAKRQLEAVVPEELAQVAAPPAARVQIASVRIAT